MLQFLTNLFSGGSAKYKELVNKGAIILDVRTPSEYSEGHIKGSVNIPVQMLQKNLGRLQKDKVIITCCASGMRSATAKAVLKSAGFAEVYNGGSWTTLQYKIYQ